MRAFIEKIRASDNRTKMRWVLLLSIACFTVVSAVWIVSMRILTSSIESGTFGAGPTVPKSPVSFREMGNSLKQGFDEIRLRTSNSYHYLKDKIASQPQEPDADGETLQVVEPETN